MTDKEAIDALQYMISGDCTDTQMDYTNEIELAISALRDRIDGGWISVEDRLPDEHDTIFAKLYGTPGWLNTMFRKCSYEVIITGIYEDKSKFVTVGKTYDGEWENPIRTIPRTITHWQPLPAPPSEKGEEP